MTASADPRAAAIAPRDGIYSRGFGLKEQIQGELEADYHSDLVDRLRAAGGTLRFGEVEVRLAKEFGFCYGVDKAIDFAYEARRNFPDRRIFLTAEIIHNPRVNRRLIEMGVRFMSGPDACGLTPDDLSPEDVVVLPAFGVSLEELARYRSRGCVLVDTTCGSVVHVWKRVEKYTRDGFTSLIHGKVRHEETIATASHAWQGGKGAWIVVYDLEEAEAVCDFIRRGADPSADRQADAAAMAARFDGKTSPGFDFARDLERVGVANQTTMLSSESLEIGARVRAAMAARHGEAGAAERFRSFDTICHATQERQDAVLEMMREPPDLMLVIGGYNSSNTMHLAEICARHCPTFHVAEVDEMLSAERIRHKPPVLGALPVESTGWLPAKRPLTVGVTAGASTPNRVIGEAIERLARWTSGEGRAAEHAS